MGGEAAPVMFGVPLAGIVLVLVGFMLNERKHAARRERVLGLGRGRLARGYLGALTVVLIFSFLAADSDRRLEVALLYYFPVFGIMLVIALTVLLLPLLALLRRFGFASLLGVVASVVGVLAFVIPILGGSFFDVLGGGVLALAFSAAARVPLIRSVGDSSDRSSLPADSAA